jgi:hypothetical protein
MLHGTMLHGWAWLKKMATDFMILSTQKFSASFTRTEALKIHKYLHPGYFFMGSHRSTHDSGIKSFILFFQEDCQVAPRSKIQCSNECNNGNALRNKKTSHVFAWIWPNSDGGLVNHCAMECHLLVKHGF